MQLLNDHEYGASVHVGSTTNSALEKLLEASGFKDVRVWNEDDAEDPEQTAGNRDNLPGAFPPKLALDPVADHWILAVWAGASGDFPVPPGVIATVDLGDVGKAASPPASPPATPPKGGGGPAPKPTPGKKATPAPAKPASSGPTTQQIVAVTAVVVGVAAIVLGAWWLHNRKRKKRKKLAAPAAPRQLTA